MARLCLRIDPQEIANPGERSVAKALVEQLPRRVEVFHSFNWLARTVTNTFVEGECDLILIEPEAGLLFVDVKAVRWCSTVRGGSGRPARIAGN